MELKPGYKQTEVGVIPEEWDVQPLSKLPCEAIDCHHSTPTWKESGEIVIRNQNIRDGRLNLTEASYTDEKAYQERIRRAVPSHPDLVITREAPMGEVCMIPVGLKCCLGQRMVLLRIQSDNVEASYVLHALQAQSSRRFIGAVGGTGSTVSNIRIPILKSLPVAVPAPGEQRKISAALGDINDLIIQLERLILKKYNIKQGTMQELLTGKRRLPGFEGEWEVTTLFDLANRKKEFFDDGDWIGSEHIRNEGIRLIQTGNIGVGRFVEKDDEKFISEKSFTSLRCKQLMQGDLLVCRLAEPAGRSCILPDIGEERIVTSVDVTIFRPPADLADRQFLNHIFSARNWLRTVSDRSGGTTHKRISRGSLGRLFLKLPSVPEQTAIAEILSEMDSEIVAIETSLEKAHSLKQGMMQQLLTGKIRLT